MNKGDKKESSLIRLNTRLSLWFIGLAIVGFLTLLLPLMLKSYDYSSLGSLGDTVGGFLNPLIGIAAALLTFLAFYIQYQANQQVQKQFEIQRFENRFFEMLRLHKENVNEMRYVKKNKGKNTLEGRKVFNVIYKEFTECLSEVRRFCKVYENQDYVREDYKVKLNEIIVKNKLNIELKELAIIDMAYSIIYFGVGKEGEILLRNTFLLKYNENFYYQLLKFMRLKPSLNNKKEFKAWKKFKNMEVDKLRMEFEKIGRNSKNSSFIYDVDGVNLMENLKRIKYYGGHQHRLGHYFRHLFQSYKYLILQENLNQEEKYFYGKSFRAQFSNYEQALIFVNSITSLGYKWELTPEIDINGNPLKMITHFQLIKNVTGNRVLDIDYDNFYKNIKFEFKSLQLRQIEN